MNPLPAQSRIRPAEGSGTDGAWRLVRELSAAKAGRRRLALIDTSGGLGNQLFQYAFGRWLERHGFRAVHEIRRLRAGADPVGRRYRLDPLGPRTLALPANRAWRGLLWRICRLQLRAEAREFSFAPPVAEPRRDAVFAGYWQHARYAAEAIEELRRVLDQVDAGDLRPGIVVGARRGDFAGAMREKIGALSPAYYAAALRRAPADLPVHVFSDDRGWAEAVLRPRLMAQGRRAVTIVTGERGDWETLALMSRGAFHVISNSTFHWWGAALSRTSRGCIAPEPWQRSLSGRCGILPAEWIAEPAVFD